MRGEVDGDGFDRLDGLPRSAGEGVSLREGGEQSGELLSGTRSGGVTTGLKYLVMGLEVILARR